LYGWLNTEEFTSIVAIVLSAVYHRDLRVSVVEGTMYS
jgi:hypothetical protein